MNTDCPDNCWKMSARVGSANMSFRSTMSATPSEGAGVDAGASDLLSGLDSSSIELTEGAGVVTSENSGEGISEQGKSLSMGAIVGLDGGGGDDGGRSSEDQSCNKLVLVCIIVDSEDVDEPKTSSSLLAIGNGCERTSRSFGLIGLSKREAERALLRDGDGEAGGSDKTERDLMDREDARAGEGVNSDMTFSGSFEVSRRPTQLVFFGVVGKTFISSNERIGDVWNARKKAPNDPLASGEDCANIGIPGVFRFGEICCFFGVVGGS